MNWLKPDNLLVDYDILNQRAVNFQLVIGDWGTAGYAKQHFGGTPIYASSVAFEDNRTKDLYAFGQMAFELFFDQSGKLLKLTKFKKIHLTNQKKYGSQLFFSRSRMKLSWQVWDR